MFGNIFRIRPKKFVGIDIGTFSIRAVEISGKRQKKQLENYGEIDHLIFDTKPFRVFEKETLVLSDDEIAQAIQLIYEEAGIQTRDAIFSIPDFCSFFTNFELPVMSKEELDEAIKYELRSYVPIPISEITIDWAVTEGEIGKTPTKVLVVAILNDIIEQYQNIARSANVDLKVLEPEVFALARAVVKNADREKLIALVDIGARTTTSSIFEKGTLKTSHSFNIAGNELTQVLAKSLNIDYNKAEAAKMKYGLTPGSENLPGGKNVGSILSPIVDAITEDIKKALRDLYVSQGKEVEKIILAGAQARLPYLKEYFASDFKKEVEIADPFSGIIFPPALEPVLKERGPSYAIAVGLALKGLE